MLFLQTGTIDVEQLADADSAARARLTETFDQITHMPFEDALAYILQMLAKVGMKILVALAIYFVGRWIIRKIGNAMARIFDRRNVDLSLRTFLLSLVKIILIIILVMVIIGILGLDTTSLLAVFASAGLALGIALSGTLQNFAGGVMVLLIKPYRVGDYIEAQDQAGTVKSIMLFHTVINTPDNKTILIPNGGISTGIVNNYSTEPTRRLEWMFGVAYGINVDKAKALLRGILDSEPKIIPDREHTIELDSLGDSSVHLVVRAWVKAPDYWDVYYSVNKKVYEQLPANGIEFPYQQIDVNLTRKPSLPANGHQTFTDADDARPNRRQPAGTDGLPHYKQSAEGTPVNGGAMNSSDAASEDRSEISGRTPGIEQGHEDRVQATPDVGHGSQGGK